MALSVDPAVGAVINIVGALGFVVLGALVALIRPRRALNSAFAAFAVTFGLLFVYSNTAVLVPAVGESSAFVPIVSLLIVLVIGAFGFLVFELPRRATHSDAGIAAVSLLAGFGTGTAYALLAPPIGGVIFGFFAALVGPAGYLAALFFLTLRYPRLASDGERRRVAVAVAGLGIFFGVASGYTLGTRHVGDATLALAMSVVAALWIRNAFALPSEARRARAVAWTLLGALLVGLAATAVFGGGRAGALAADSSGLPGVARLVGVSILAYGILRHQLLDIDLKIRWTVRRGTLAAVFLAVFFVAAQLAQNLLSETYGWAIGGLAAGLLLFAIAPIQRVAERVADRAVPGVKAPGDMTSEERARVYAEQARLAWEDGHVDARDRAVLDRLRATLGLPADEALRLESEAAPARA